jgi:hypothetical protein
MPQEFIILASMVPAILQEAAEIDMRDAHVKTTVDGARMLAMSSTSAGEQSRRFKDQLVIKVLLLQPLQLAD